MIDMLVELWVAVGGNMRAAVFVIPLRVDVAIDTWIVVLIITLAALIVGVDIGVLVGVKAVVATSALIG